MSNMRRQRRHWNNCESGSGWAAVAVGCGVLCAALAPRPAAACEPVTVCAEWAVELEDGPWGAHLTEPTVPARGARMTIIRPSPEPPLGLFLDNDGCATFETQYAAGHKAVIYSEAVYDEHVRVRVFESEADQASGGVHVWPVDFPAVLNGDAVLVTVPVTDEWSQGKISSVLGAATETLDRLNALPPGLPPQDRTLNIHYDHANRNANGGIFDIRLGRDSNSEKYVLAHEMGHWLEQGFTGQGFFPVYNYETTDPDCGFAIDTTVTEDDSESPLGEGQSNFHGIRSAEHGHAAMTEAYAHFVAAAAYSSGTYETGMFRYYKDIFVDPDPPDDVVPPYQNFVDNENVVALAHTSHLGGEVRWTAEMCAGGDGDGGNDWAPPTSTGIDISTELDWLRFFWGFYRNPDAAGPEPTFWDILNLIAYSHNNYFWPDHEDGYSSSNPTAWGQLVSAVNTTGSGVESFAARLTGLEPTYEVIND